MKVKSSVYFWFFVGVFIFFLGVLYNHYIIYKVKTGEHVVVCARIINQRMFRSAILVWIKFEYENSSYELEADITSESYYQFEDGKRNILIVFPKGQPKSFYFLESKKDFEKFGIIPQDTVSINCSDKIQNW